MFGKRFKLFKLFGFPVYADLSWLVIVFLVTWSLGVGLFPRWFPDLSANAYWIMAIVGALGLFAAIVLHELAHARVAQHYGMPMKGITLFIFGGVAEMEEQSPSPKSELLVAVAGPAASIVIGAVCLGVYVIGTAARWPVEVTGIFGYLAFINAILVAFNLIPAFPLDGGRVLRAALWKWKNNVRWATNIASQVGSGFGIALFILGVVSLLAGNLIGGLWWILIGLFVRSAAKMSYQQLQIRRALQGEPVKRFMGTTPATVSRTTSVAHLVEDYVYRYHFKMFPVADNGALHGCVTTKEIKDVPREEWDRRTVAEIAKPCSAENTIAPDEDAVKALAKMQRGGASRLMVVDRGELVGVLTLKDLLRFISMKLDLEDDETARPALMGR
jgi:Zn-dependent protease/CBS domain-containing protein